MNAQILGNLCKRLGVLAALSLALGAHADDQVPVASHTAVGPVQLEGTLAKAAASGTIAIAYRDASLPFSFLDAHGKPVGYSIDLCHELVKAAEAKVGRELAVRWVPVTSDSRIEAITSGKADLECGSTTSNLERQKVVAFSPIMFISGTKLMVHSGSPVRTYRDLGGRKVVVTAGTTNDKALRNLLAKNGIAATIMTARDHAQAFAMLATGQADAMANDDVLLYGFMAREQAQGRGGLTVVGDYLSYDPYGVMFRKQDAQLAALVNNTFRKLAEEGDMQRLYRRWFLRRLPESVSMNLPMSAQLESTIEALKVAPQQ